MEPSIEPSRGLIAATPKRLVTIRCAQSFSAWLCPRTRRQPGRDPQVGDVVDARLLENAPTVTRQELAEQGSRREPGVGDVVERGDKASD